MTNKKYLFNEAENLYVNQLKTVETIARELNLCRKTVMLWKESGDWDRKKLELHKARMTIHEKMYKFAQKLLNAIQLFLLKNRKSFQLRLTINQALKFTSCKANAKWRQVTKL